MTGSIQIPAKGQRITADWAAKVTRAANAVGALGSAGMLVREGGNGVGFEPLPENPKLRSSGGGAAADKGVFKLVLETDSVTLADCFYMAGGRIVKLPDLDITDKVGSIVEERLAVDKPFVAYRVPASASATEEEGVAAYDSADAMVAASEDLDYVTIPLYMLTETGGVSIDFRNIPVAVAGEAEL